MSLTPKQVTAFNDLFLVLGNIQKRCIMQGIDIHASQRKDPSRQEQTLPKKHHERTKPR